MSGERLAAVARRMDRWGSWRWWLCMMFALGYAYKDQTEAGAAFLAAALVIGELEAIVAAAARTALQHEGSEHDAG